MQTNQQITPLHVRSGYSLGRGTLLPERLLRRAGQLGHAHLALTDVNNLYGATAFSRLAEAAGIEPILGAELAEGACAAVALVADETGYENLCRIITRVHRRQSPPAPARPRQRAASTSERAASASERSSGAPPLLGDLVELGEGLHLIVEDPRLAEALLSAGAEPKRLWLGLDPPTQSLSRLRALVESAAGLGLPLAATGKALLAGAEDYDTARLLSAIRLGTTFAEVAPEELPHPRAVLRAPGELARQLVEFPQALANNRRLAEQCRYRLFPRRPVFPGFAPPGGLSAEEYLRSLCREGMRRRYGPIPPELAEVRLEKELNLISRLGFCEYFLVVWDIVQYARRHGAPVAGRGSGASSLVAYVLGITNVCPLAFNIPFERFLHEGRQDFPDLDMDFCWRIRDEVIAYAFRRWGVEHVAMVSMHLTFQARSALRETAKAMGLSDEQVSRVAREGPEEPEGMPEILRLARKIIALPHNLSVHPGGIVIGRKPIDRYVPIQPAPKGVMITQYDKDGIEDIRLVKLDLLGNRCLSTVRFACDLVGRREGSAVDVEALPPDDAATIRTLCAGDTVGCNQLESPAMRALLRMMQPAGVRDVMQALALIRPGAASIGMKETFIRRHRGLEKAPRGHPEADALLADTHGVMLYEDDVMLVAAALTGAPLAEADRFRKAIQKCRDDDQRLGLSREFLARCRDNGADESFARDLWVQMAKFNAYSFCRAHAASYALLAYAGAYLKTHHPLEFWTSALNNNQSMYASRVYVEQAKRAGIRFLLPDVNRSEAEFSLDSGAIRVGAPDLRGMGVPPMASTGMLAIPSTGETPVPQSAGAIRVGLNLVAGLGPVGVETILRARGRRAIESVSDLLARTHLAREQVRALVLCGALDFTGRTRPSLMAELEMLSGPGTQAERLAGDLLPARPTVPEVPGDYAPRRKYIDEWRILGISVREHFLRHYRKGLAGAVDADSRDLARSVGRKVRLTGVVEAVRTTPTRSGDTMMFLTLDDEYGLVEVSVFPDVLRKSPPINRYGPYVVAGSVEQQYGALTLSAERIYLHHPEKAKAAS